MMVTAFKNIYDLKNPNFVRVEKVLDRVRSGASKDRITKIRTLESKDLRNEQKKGLPSICFSGRFTERADNKILEHSGLVVLDWDGLTDVEKKKSEISKDPYTYAVWVSPSGNGIKALVKIPKEPLNHESYYLSLLEKYPELDTSNKNLSRVCYESYDPNIFINPDSDVWNKINEINLVERTPIPLNKDNGYAGKVVERVWKTASDIVSNSADGERHMELIKAAKLLGGYSHYGVGLDMVKSVLGSITVARGSDKNYNHEKTISDGFKYGEAKPIYINDNHTVTVPVLGRDETSQPKKASELLSNGKKESEWLDLVFKNNIPKGLPIGSEEFDEHYRFKRRTMVGIFGIDNTGKTTFYIFMAVCYAKRHGLKFLLICRENSSASIRQKIIELYLGRYAHQCETSEQHKAKDFSYDHFDILDEKTEINYDNFFDVVKSIYARKKYDACFVDPYNAIQYDQLPKKNYEFLGKIRKLQNELDTSFHISMHISTERARNFNYNNKEFITTFSGEVVMVDGQMKIPRKNFVEGGQPIANKLDDIIIVHRIQKIEQLRNYTLISIDKVKEEQTGGMVTFEKPIMFQKQYGFISFLDSDGFNPLKAQEKSVPTQFPKQTPAQAFTDEPDEDNEVPF